jgi:flagella synthesis protein FlgN
VKPAERNERFARAREILSPTVEAARRLKGALEDERSALENEDMPGLAAAGSRKRVHIGELEKLEARRRQLLERFRYDNDLSSMRSFIEACDDNGVLAARWRELIEVLEQCRHLNTVNGTVVQARRHQVAEALSVVRGSDNDVEVYGPGGKTETTGRFRALAEV